MNAALPMPAKPHPVANRLLATLPDDEFARIERALATVQVAVGAILYEPGQIIRTVYFPSDSLISLQAVVDGRMTLEVGLVGSEGVLGASVALGRDIAQVRAVVQQPGTALCMDSAQFCVAFKRNPALQRVLHRYVDAMLTQSIQIAACSRFHLLEARLARSLLITRDRLQSDTFHLTHEFLAHALGVRRVGVTKAASALQNRKMITYARGNIEILDVHGLTAVSCGCGQAAQETGQGAQSD